MPSARLSRAALAALFFSALAAAAPVAERVQACYACHGERGQSAQPDIPSLGGQPSFFLLTQLFLFREGRRGGPMIELAKGWSDDELRGFADHLAAQLPPPAPPRDAPDAARLARAQALLAKEHCGVCHNPDYSGREQMPRLAHQREDYLLKALRDFKSGRRIGYGQAMSQELARLGDEDLADLAHYFAHFAPHR
jgi:cytochrome c553